MSVAESWKRIAAWGEANAPTMLEDLNPGASDDAIAALEDQLGQTIPEDFRESLRVHDGESDGWPSKVFADCGAYLGTERIFETWQMRLQIAEEVSVYQEDAPPIEEQIRDGIIFVVGPVRPETYRKEWIPIMDCNGDVFWAIDLAPADGGTVGQIIEVDLECCSWKVVAASFAEFIGEYASRLESGAYHIVEGLPTMEDDD